MGCLKYSTTVWHVDQVNQNSEDKTFLCLICGESHPRKDGVVVLLDPQDQALESHTEMNTELERKKAGGVYQR